MAATQSYHVLAASISGGDAPPERLFARSVQAVVQGFIPHASYLRLAGQASAAVLPADRLDRQMRQVIALDANPIAELIRSARDEATFAHRWNGFNRDAPLGVQTLVARDAVQRHEKVAEPYRALRDQVAASCIAALQALRRTRASEGEVPCRLSTQIAALNLGQPLLHDCVQALHQQPGMPLADCARRLGTSRRTLQRELLALGLRFNALRQAVRVTAAGHALRTRPQQALTAIAQDAGFFDSAHFVRAWRQACGITPSQYRALCAPPQGQLRPRAVA